MTCSSSATCPAVTPSPVAGFTPVDASPIIGSSQCAAENGARDDAGAYSAPAEAPAATISPAKSTAATAKLDLLDVRGRRGIER